MTVIFRVLGEPAVEVDGRIDVPRSGRQRSLIALLAIAEGHHVRADQAIDCLWPDGDRDAARRHLRVLVGTLRNRLGAERNVLATRNGGYCLVGGEVDVDMARRAVEEGCRLAAACRWHEATDHLEHAMRDWRGEPLGSIADEPWLRDVARELCQLREDALLALCDARLAIDRADLAAPLLDAAVAGDDPSVAVLERHVRACALAGRIEDAAASCARAIRTSTPRDRARLQQLQRQVLANDPAVWARRVVGAPELPPPPVVSSSFVGRDQSIEELRAAIRGGTRAITLLGPGGVGKSRVANELARSMDGVIEAVGWIDLTRVESAAAIPGLLLGALGITGGGDDPLDAIGQAIGSRRLLLVMDNAEHVVEVASVIDGLLARCPNLLLVVTSRTVLDATTLIVPLSPLAAHGEPGRPPHSVQLFLDRAYQVDGLVDDSPAALDVILEVCEAVDHLPLGIELAAARTALLTPSQVLAGLHRRFDLLRTRDASVPERQRSLLRVVQWSYELLDDRGRRALQTAAAFAGGCTLDDFVAVGQPTTRRDAVEELDQLAAQSLLVRERTPRGELRWRMLDTIAGFARRRLEESADGRDRCRRHALRMLHHARAANTHRPEAAADRARLIAELSNVHAAIDWAVDHDAELAATIYGSLRRYYLTSGSMPEGADIGERVLDRLGNASGEAAPRTAFLAGYLQHFLGRSERAAVLLARARRGFVLQGSERSVAAVDVARADGVRLAGDHVAAEALLDGAIEVARASGDRWLLAWAEATLAFVQAEAGAWSPAEERLVRARKEFEEEGDEYWKINVDVNLAAHRAIVLGDTAALEVLELAMARLTDLGFWSYAAYVRVVALRCRLEGGDFDATLEAAGDAITLATRSGDALLLLYATSCIAAGAVLSGHLEAAGRYGTQAAMLASSTGGHAYLDYALVALAAWWQDRGDDGRARAALELVDAEAFEDRYLLDRRLRERYLQMLDGHPDTPPVDRAAGLAGLVERIPS